MWLRSDTAFKLGEGNPIALCFLLGRRLCAWLTATARPGSHTSRGSAELHSHLALHCRQMSVGKKAWSGDCVRMITFPLGEPPGIWNRLGYSEAVNAADNAWRGGKHPRGPGLPDFGVRLWMRSPGSRWRKGAFLNSPLFNKETFFSPSGQREVTCTDQNLLTLLNFPNSGKEMLVSASSRRVSLTELLGIWGCHD